MKRPPTTGLRAARDRRYEAANRWLRYYRWAKRRCVDPKHKSYWKYGGRGIRFLLTAAEVKALWLRDRANLLARPSLDRIDSKDDYVFENCRFIELADNCSAGGSALRQHWSEDAAA